MPIIPSHNMYSNILLMLIEQSSNYYELETLLVVSFYHIFLNDPVNTAMFI